jgi:hypothetical protein
MWSKERVLTFIEDLQSNACLWDMNCPDYENRNKKGDAIDFLARKYKISTTEVKKKSTISEVSFGWSIKRLSIQEDRVFIEETKLVEQAPRPNTFHIFWSFLSSH